MSIEDIIDFLRKKNWPERATGSNVIQFISPDYLGFTPNIEINIPQVVHPVDLDRFISRTLDTLSEVYDISVTELSHIIKPLINCYTHLYTADHLPPFLAKSFLPFPLYYLFPVDISIKLHRLWYRTVYSWQFRPFYKKARIAIYEIRLFLIRTRIPLLPLCYILILLQAFFVLSYKIGGFEVIRNWLVRGNLALVSTNTITQTLAVLFVLLFSQIGRKLVSAVVKTVGLMLAWLAGEKTMELIRRFVNIGRFSYRRGQRMFFRLLKDQYAEGAGFIVLPMDFRYMDAGRLKPYFTYQHQMEELAAIKTEYPDNIYPFVFADPREISSDTSFNHRDRVGGYPFDNTYFREYIEEKRFAGFNIYPALGYYPFDERLLPVWKYAADNAIPIVTHCSRSLLYYRGQKQKQWDRHPVFLQSKSAGSYEPLLLPDIKNADFTANFTHPLNFLCLLEERLLRILVARSDRRIQEMFGFSNQDTPLMYNLRHLKICFGQFGGKEEWDRFVKRDQDNHSSNEFLKNPDRGIAFLDNNFGAYIPGKIELIWRWGDWYSIICSLMLQYPSVYADISGILNDPDNQPLLKQTLLNAKLKTKVLFATGYNAIQKHKSERSLLAELTENLTQKELDLVARINPREFLRNRLHGDLRI